MKHHNYYLYILTNPKKTTLYTGVTNDLDRRIEEHFMDSDVLKKTFAGMYNCYNLIYYEWYQDVREAIGREKEVKGWIRAKKEALINSFNPNWRILNSLSEIEKGGLPVWHVEDAYWRPGPGWNKK